MSDGVGLFWVYLERDPLIWLLITLLGYGMAQSLFLKFNRNPVFNPVALSVIFLGSFLLISGTSYEEYFAGAQFIHVLLGPAVVCLAVPIWTHRKSIARSAVPLAIGLSVGSAVSVISAVGLGWALGLDETVLLSLVPKSVTAPVAMGIAEDIGGIASLAVGLCIATGITGGILVTPLMNALKVKDWRARGLAAGVASHGIGTARAFQVSEVAGVYSSIGMALNALLTALAVGLIVLF